MDKKNKNRKTLWALYESWDFGWWQPLRDGEKKDMEDLMERLKALPPMLGKRILRLEMTNYGERPDKTNN